jgi:polyisoprenoid-binding protein YceI
MAEVLEPQSFVEDIGKTITEMKKYSFWILFIGMALNASAQKYVLEKSSVTFFSEAAIENITAKNGKTNSVLNTQTAEVAFSVPIREFQFAKKLMQEHFNEKYMESELYPNATFSGKIIEQTDFSKDGTYEVRAKGDLDIHGQKQIRIIKSKLVIANGTITINTSFKVPLADHNISIPSIVNQKIATEIVINVNATLTRKI